MGHTLLIPSGVPAIDNPVALPEPFQTIGFSAERIAQGHTLVVSATLSTSATLTARFEDRPIALTGDGRHYWGIVGIHALTDGGVYSVAFVATRPDGSQSAVAHKIAVVSGGYNTETIVVSCDREGWLDPSVISSEAEKRRFIWNQVNKVVKPTVVAGGVAEMRVGRKTAGGIAALS